jgi:hypothetical protein
MNYDSKIAPQTPLLFNNFQTKGRLKSHSVPPRTKRLPSNGCIESDLMRSNLTDTVAPVRFRYSSNVSRYLSGETSYKQTSGASWHLHAQRYTVERRAGI